MPAEPLLTEDDPSKKKRLLSLDCLRGFDMFWIVSGEGIVHGLAKATNSPVFNTMSNQLEHTDWNGFTAYDLIFPLFVFIAGVSMPYSLGRKLEALPTDAARAHRRAIYSSLIKRTLILILLGTVVNHSLRFEGFDQTRFASVLGRIALSCFFAAVIYLNFSLRGQILWLFGLLLGYWALMAWVPVPGFGAGVLTKEGNLEAYIDQVALPGRLYRPTYDPEGLLSTLPAIGSALLGVLTGQFLKSKAGAVTAQKSLYMAGAGILLLMLSLLWNLVFPINKNLWSSSFVLHTAGWSLLLLSLFYFVIDVKGIRRWASPFKWVGMNSILIYMAAHGVVNFESTSTFLFGGLINKTPAEWHGVWLWTGVAAIQFYGLWLLYRKRWFLRV